MMDLTSPANLEEFIRNVDVPVQWDENLLSWQEEPFRFIVEWQETHLIMSIEQLVSEADAERQLLNLYRRAVPQRFMGLPVRIYRQALSITGALALPWHAAETGYLLRMRDALRRLFESSSPNAD